MERWLCGTSVAVIVVFIFPDCLVWFQNLACLDILLTTNERLDETFELKENIGSINTVSVQASCEAATDGDLNENLKRDRF